MTAKKCDRCGKYYLPYETKANSPNPNTIAFTIKNDNGARFVRDFDLCEDCMKAIETVLKGDVPFSEKCKKVLDGLKACNLKTCGKENCPYYEGVGSEAFGSPDGWRCDYDLRTDAMDLVTILEAFLDPKAKEDD